mmetsp:Transcript_9218/g.24128  ORF Transcript_9218/g.24128 Transcript_9218/m.24128 type:complete len:246 (+) Transcript_9218:842-1579(+)
MAVPACTEICVNVIERNSWSKRSSFVGSWLRPPISAPISPIESQSVSTPTRPMTSAIRASCAARCAQPSAIVARVSTTGGRRSLNGSCFGPANRGTLGGCSHSWTAGDARVCSAEPTYRAFTSARLVPPAARWPPPMPLLGTRLTSTPPRSLSPASPPGDGVGASPFPTSTSSKASEAASVAPTAHVVTPRPSECSPASRFHLESTVFRGGPDDVPATFDPLPPPSLSPPPPLLIASAASVVTSK